MQLNLNDLSIAKAYIERRISTDSANVNEKFGSYSDLYTNKVVPAWETIPGKEYLKDQVTYFVDADYE